MIVDSLNISYTNLEISNKKKYFFQLKSSMTYSINRNISILDELEHEI